MHADWLGSVVIPLLVWFASAARLLCRRYVNVDECQVLEARISAYASMHGAKTGSRSAPLLSGGEHAILLGILKKIESKNATMVAVWSFLFSALVALISLDDEFSTTAACFVLVILPFVLAAIGGTRQLDNYSEAARNFSKDDKFASKLQEELKSDLLRKEALFDFTKTGAVLFLPIFSFMLFYQVAFDITVVIP